MLHGRHDARVHRPLAKYHPFSPNFVMISDTETMSLRRICERNKTRVKAEQREDESGEEQTREGREEKKSREKKRSEENLAERIKDKSTEEKRKRKRRGKKVEREVDESPALTFLGTNGIPSAALVLVKDPHGDESDEATYKHEHRYTQERVLVTDIRG